MTKGQERDRKSAGAGSGVGLLLIDVINPLDFDGADKLAPAALAASESIRRLVDQAHAQGVPVIYVNDNYGHWNADRRQLIERCADASPAARQIIDRLRPSADDYFTIKPRFSGFYGTHLSVLLPDLGVDRLVLAGFAADICVLFTAGDAHMRQYDLWIPRDAVASEAPSHAEWALNIMRKSMGAETAPTDELDLASWVARDKAV